MNPEEFDKRLSGSFKNEHLPPDKRLWENISLRLDENRKKPLWFWLIPVVIVGAVLGGWFITGNGPAKSTIAVESTALTSTVSEDANSKTKNTPALNKQASIEKVEIKNDIVNSPSPRHTSEANTTVENHQEVPDININRFSDATRKNPVTPITNNKSNFLVSYVQPVITYTEVDIFRTFLKMNALIPPAKPNYMAPKEEMLAYETPFKNRKAYKSPYTNNPVNFDSKWWWSLGMGPQVSFNKAVVPNDSQEWVHKELWANKDKMSGNGTGFHSQFLVGRRLGKYFSVEAGLHYNKRTEDIRFNFSSYDIEGRDNNNKILFYLRLKIFISPSPGDTTWYDATRGFQLSVKNRYNVYTIPVKFNFEYPVSDRTKFVAGIGAGFSIITTKKATHLNLINDRESFDRKANQYTASLNAQFGFYTNFNDVGQLGIYSGFQMYTHPWEVSHKQYGIKMSDLQLGLSFRKPLNW